MQRHILTRQVLPIAFVCWILLATSAGAGSYSASVHGDPAYGVCRLDADYAPGNCAHCHELHASIQGTEPVPSGGPDDYTLLAEGYVSDSENVCVVCHDGTSTVATSVITNHSYSYRAGNLAVDYAQSIKEMFDTTGNMASTHNLEDMKALLTGTVGTAWGFTDHAQPCEGCHNPHALQGDPANSASGRKNAAARGFPLSRPSDYMAATGWELWGDQSGEKMSDYVGALTYQAPYYGGSSSTYEPEGNAISDGSNLTDVNTFCSDCHNLTTTIYSRTLDRHLYQFDWSNEVHGRVAAINQPSKTETKSPYVDTLQGSYVLACTDCHEPHGSPNVMLIRPLVNNGSVDLPAGTTNWRSLCTTCHVAGSDMKSFHHQVRSSYSGCSVCHPASDKSIIENCTTCHYHSASHPTVPSYKMF